MRRIQVIGLPGSGKSTLAKRLAERLESDFIQLDALFWLKDWQMRPTEEFQALVDEKLDRAKHGWVVDGHYPKRGSPRVAKESDLVVVLDMPVWLCRRRVLQRGLRRIVLRRKVYGNQETLVGLLRLLKAVGSSYTALQQTIEGLTASNRKVIHFTSNADADRWLETQ